MSFSYVLFFVADNTSRFNDNFYDSRFQGIAQPFDLVETTNAAGILRVMGTNHPNLWYNQAEIDKLRSIILGSEPAVKKTELVNIYNTKVKGALAVNAPTNWFTTEVDNCNWINNACTYPAVTNWKDSYLLALPLGAANMKAGASFMIEPTSAKAQRIKSAILSFSAYPASKLYDPQNTGQAIWPVAWLYDLTYSYPGLYTSEEKVKIEAFFSGIANAMKNAQGNGYLPMWKKVQDENGTLREGYENWFAFYAGQGVVLSLVGNNQTLLDYFSKGPSSYNTLWFTPTSQGATGTNPSTASNIRDLYQYVNGMVYPSGKTWDYYVRINDGNKLYHEFSLWGVYLGLEAAAHNGWNGWNENIVNGKPAMRRAIDWQIQYHPMLQSGGRYPAGKAAFNIRRFYNSSPIIQNYVNGVNGSKIDETGHSYIFGDFGRIFMYPMYSTSSCVASWKCESPLNGYEYDGCGNRRLNAACNATTSTNLAPNSSFESDPNTDYYTNGTAAFTWATDSYHAGTHSIKIVSSQSTALTRWMSRTTKIAATPGKTYAASAWMKSNVSGKVNFVINFWNASQTYLGGFESTYLTTINTWKQLSTQGIAPANAAYARVEFRLYGPGTLWSDDVNVTIK